MSRQNSQSGSYHPAYTTYPSAYMNGRNMMRNQPPTSSAPPTQNERHNCGLQQNHDGKENPPSTCCRQAELERAQVLQMGPAVLQNSMASNVHHGDQYPATGKTSGYVSRHPTAPDFVPVSHSDDTSAPVAQRFTLPVLSYQSNRTIQNHGSIFGAQTSHESSSVILSPRQQTGVNGTPIAGNGRRPAPDILVGANANRDMVDHLNNTNTRSFRVSQLSPNVRTGNSRANATLQVLSQPYFPTPCPPPSPEIQHSVSPKIHLPSIHPGTSSQLSFPPGVIPTTDIRARSGVSQSTSRLGRLSTVNEISAEHPSRIVRQSNRSLNSATVGVKLDAYSLHDKSGTDKTPTQKSAACHYASSSHSHKREGSITPTQAFNKGSTAVPHDINGPAQPEINQGSVVYDSRRGNAVPQTVPQLRHGKEPLSSSQGRIVDCKSTRDIDKLDHQRPVRRNSVAYSRTSETEDGRCESRKIHSRPRASSLNEHAAPFIPGQRTHSTPSQPSIHSEDNEPNESNGGLDAPSNDNDFNKYLERFLDAFLNWDNLKEGLIIPEPIYFEDVASHVRPVCHGVLPLLASANATRSAEGCINWLKFQGNSPAAIEYLSRYLAVSLFMANSHMKGIESKHCYYLLRRLVEGLTNDNIREQFCACLFSTSARFAQSILTVDIPPGVTGPSYFLLLEVVLVQAIIIGTLFRLSFVNMTSIVGFLWSLLEYRPHLARILTIHKLIITAGEFICHPTNSRQIGDFLMTLHRKYVVPPPGGSLPDVYLAPEEHKQAIFERVRFLLQVRFSVVRFRCDSENLVYIGNPDVNLPVETCRKFKLKEVAEEQI
ncbi:hypothetical protein F5050DRAFT_1727971 [Lentinula boryana]|uniref:Uncharacterized protein n=1 Tax=Lentinula boryana TaxID=40481 RepID=A0ABQ8QQ49_9AGAR|nr:hypothetical protein F5050DRAFT_1727971 [Lentinula boryana]